MGLDSGQVIKNTCWSCRRLVESPNTYTVAHSCCIYICRALIPLLVSEVTRHMHVHTGIRAGKAPLQ